MQWCPPRARYASKTIIPIWAAKASPLRNRRSSPDGSRGYRCRPHTREGRLRTLVRVARMSQQNAFCFGCALLSNELGSGCSAPIGFCRIRSNGRGPLVQGTHSFSVRARPVCLTVISTGSIILYDAPICSAEIRRRESCAGSGGKERRRKLTENSGACSSLHGWSLWRSWQ